MEILTHFTLTCKKSASNLFSWGPINMNMQNQNNKKLKELLTFHMTRVADATRIFSATSTTRSHFYPQKH
jgi:hypothetical protein